MTGGRIFHFQFLQFILLGQGVQLLVRAVQTGRIAFGGIGAIAVHRQRQVSVFALIVGQGKAELRHFHPVSVAPVACYQTVQPFIGRCLFPRELLELDDGRLGQLFLAGIVDDGGIVQHGILHGFGLLEPVQALEQHEAVAGLLETAAVVQFSQLFFHPQE